jgi:MFS family permease
MIVPVEPDNMRSISERWNIRGFYGYRVFFHARFYYPVFAILFLDFGLSLEQFALLNAVWAATIVLLEVPSGAFADAWGRVRLLRLSACLMILELLLILLAPVGNSRVVFWMFFLNRIVSGASEAMGSGADEALAYDTLVLQGREARWPQVLESVMRLQSIGFIVAMTMGGLLYDQALCRRLLTAFGIELQTPHPWLMRLPIFATFIGAILVLISTLLMREPKLAESEEPVGILGSFRIILQSGYRVYVHPVLFLVIFAGLLHDSVIRLLLTLSSEFYRWVGIDARFFGILGSAMAVLGLVVPTLGRKLVGSKEQSVLHFGLTAVLTLIALTGLGQFRNMAAGIGFMALMMAAFSLLNYFVSYYLNRDAPSRERATILSFRGLAYNLGYGIMGLLYAGYCRLLPFENDDEVFGAALKVLPVWFMLTMVVLVVVAIMRSKGKRS